MWLIVHYQLINYIILCVGIVIFDCATMVVFFLLLLLLIFYLFDSFFLRGKIIWRTVDYYYNTLLFIGEYYYIVHVYCTILNIIIF